MKLFQIKFIIIALIFISCKQKNDNIICYIDNNPVTYEEVDNTIKQELYDALNNIYITRKIALDNVISQKLLSDEAIRTHTTVDSLINTLYSKQITSSAIKQFARDNNLEEEISIFKGRLLYYKTNSPEGQKALVENYKKFVLKKHVDSLRSKHKIDVILKEPVRPRIELDQLLVHFKGNLNSKVSFVVISDFECDKCREYNYIFDSIYYKYGKDIKFGFVNYGSYVSNIAIAAECANNQNKFWEFHDIIFNQKKLQLDSAALFDIAKSLKLDLVKFKDDYQKNAIAEKLEKNLMDIRTSGIYGTPTIMINDKIIFNSASLKDIIKTLEEEIRKRK